MMLRQLAIRYVFAAALMVGFSISILAQPDELSAAAQKEVDVATALMTKGDKTSLEQAIARLDHAIELLAKTNNISLAAEAYFSRAVCKINSGQSADSDLTKVLELSPGNPSNMFLANAFLAGSFTKKGDDPAAKPYLDKVWELLKDGSYEKLDPGVVNSDTGITLIKMAGLAFVRLKERQKAIDVLWRNYQIASKLSDEQAIAALDEYSDAQMKLGTPRLAVEPLELALKRATSAKLRRKQAEVAEALGDLYMYYLDEIEKAGPYLRQALEIAEELKSEELLYQTLTDVGQFEYRSVNFSLALSHYERALKLATSAGAPQGDQSSILYNISQVQFGLGDDVKGAATLDQALEKAKDGNAPSIEAAVIVDQTTRRIQKDGDKVDAAWIKERLNRAAGLVKDSPGGQKMIAGWLENWGMLAINTGMIDLAMPVVQTSLEHARRWGFKFNEGMALENLGLIENMKGDHRAAIDNLNAALVIFRELGIPAHEGRALEHLMWTWHKLGNPSLATFFGKSAVNIYQGFRKETADLNADQRSALMGNFEYAYRELANILIEQGRLSEAERVLTMLKQEELIEYVRRDDSVAKQMLESMPISDDERAAISRYDQLAEKITAAGKEFDDLDQEIKQFPAGAFPKQARYNELKQQLADATTTFQKFLEELKLKFGQTDSRIAEVDSGLKTTLRAMKADHTAVVSTIVGQDSLNVIVTTSRTQRAHTLPVGAKAINELVAKLREGLTSPKFDPRPASQQLYDLLVKPIEGDLTGIKADTIVWSLDGTLRYIPPAALWDKDKGYLVERFANVIINLASRDKIKDAPDKNAKLSVLGVGVSKSVEGFAALSAVPDELDCIVDDKAAGILSAKPECRNGVLEGKKLLDDKFTLASFEGELGRYPIVHIATHFKLTPGDDKNSFILMGGGDDKRFTVARLRSEQALADIELIVLSACNTATPGGAKANGVEIEGFGSIAQDEGAKAVMASLWPVADASTKDLMVEFYRLYGKESRSKAEAIRAAQLKLLRGSYPADSGSNSRGVPFASSGSSLPPFTADPKAPFAHPYYWSPFVLMGNWQ